MSICAPGHCPQQPWLRRQGVRNPARPPRTSDPHGNRHRHSDRHPRRSRRHRCAEPHRVLPTLRPADLCSPQPRSLNDTREHYRRLLDDGRAPPCPPPRQRRWPAHDRAHLAMGSPSFDGQPYIGPTATDPSVRRPEASDTPSPTPPTSGLTAPATTPSPSTSSRPTCAPGPSGSDSASNPPATGSAERSIPLTPFTALEAHPPSRRDQATTHPSLNAFLSPLPRHPPPLPRQTPPPGP